MIHGFVERRVAIREVHGNEASGLLITERNTDPNCLASGSVARSGSAGREEPFYLPELTHNFGLHWDYITRNRY